MPLRVLFLIYQSQPSFTKKIIPILKPVAKRSGYLYLAHHTHILDVRLDGGIKVPLQDLLRGSGVVLDDPLERGQHCHAPGVGAADNALGVLQPQPHDGRVDTAGGEARGVDRQLSHFVSHLASLSLPLDQMLIKHLC